MMYAAKRQKLRGGRVFWVSGAPSCEKLDIPTHLPHMFS
jgi:hypothetical protein